MYRQTIHAHTDRNAVLTSTVPYRIHKICA